MTKEMHAKRKILDGLAPIAKEAAYFFIEREKPESIGHASI